MADRQCNQCGVVKPDDQYYSATRSTCKRCRNAAVTEWRADNPEKCHAYSKKWRENHPEEVRTYQRAWCKANPEKNLARTTLWRENNRERSRAYNIEYHRKRRIKAKLKESILHMSKTAEDRANHIVQMLYDLPLTEQIAILLGSMMSIIVANVPEQGDQVIANISEMLPHTYQEAKTALKEHMQ